MNRITEAKEKLAALDEMLNAGIITPQEIEAITKTCEGFLNNVLTSDLATLSSVCVSYGKTPDVIENILIAGVVRSRRFGAIDFMQEGSIRRRVRHYTAPNVRFKPWVV